MEEAKLLMVLGIGFAFGALSAWLALSWEAMSKLPKGDE